ncbi:hypothetical protein CC86DRAFT_373408 [Ophiobolus disseminans]|uniref:Uncharacterized protein n=1 Tax=Ophiobolus disseminans TaxID=1469910 RepID=A0A6A6ZMG1_9PLEO|nr:hypothetical protein CC86DRAFT_373408 [Ophiobolus disseminans]
MTMFRSLATASSRTLRTTAPARQLSLSASRKVEKTQTQEGKHAVNKAKEGDTHNVQESNAKAGMDAQKSGTGGNATEGKDSAGGKAKAKKEFPEAPDPAIGMQDERGGRGG